MSQYQDIFDQSGRNSNKIGHQNVPLHLERNDSRQTISIQEQRRGATMPIYLEDDTLARPTLPSFKSTGNKPRNFAPELYVQAMAAKTNLGLFDSLTNTAALDALRAYGSTTLPSPHSSPKRTQNPTQNFSARLTDYHHGSTSEIASLPGMEDRNIYKQSNNSSYNPKSYGGVSQYQGNIQTQYVTAEQNQGRAKYSKDMSALHSEFDDDTRFSQGSTQHNQSNTPDSNTDSFASFKPLVELNTVEDEDEFLYGGDSNPSVDTPVFIAPAEKAVPPTFDTGNWSDDEVTVIDKESLIKLRQPDGSLASKLQQGHTKKKIDLDKSGIALKDITWTTSVAWKDDEQDTSKAAETSVQLKESKITYDPLSEFCASISKHVEPKKTIQSSEKILRKASTVTGKAEKKKIPPKKANARYMDDSKYAAAAELLRKQLKLDKPGIESTEPREASYENSKQMSTSSGKRMKFTTDSSALLNFVVNIENENLGKRTVHSTESNVDFKNSAKSTSSMGATQDKDISQAETQRVVREKSKNIPSEQVKPSQTLPKQYMDPDCKKLDDKYVRENFKGKSHQSPDRYRSYSRSPRRRSPRKFSKSPEYRFRRYNRFQEHSSRHRSRSRPRPRYGRSRERSPRQRSRFRSRGRSPRRESDERRYRQERSPSHEYEGTRSRKRSHSPEDLLDTDKSKPFETSSVKLVNVRKPISFSIGSAKPSEEGLLKNSSSLDEVTSVIHALQTNTAFSFEMDQEALEIDMISLMKVVAQSDQLDEICWPQEETEDSRKYQGKEYHEQQIDKALYETPISSAPQVVIPDFSIPPPQMTHQAMPPYLPQVSQPLTQFSQLHPYNMQQSFSPNAPSNYNFNPMYPPPVSPTGAYLYQQPPPSFPLAVNPTIGPQAVPTTKPALLKKRTCALKPVPLLAPLSAFADEEDQSSQVQNEHFKNKTISSDPRGAIEMQLRKISGKSPASPVESERALVSRYQKLLEERDLIQKKLRNTSDHTIELRNLKKELDQDSKNMRTSADKQLVQSCHTVFDIANDELNRFIREAKDVCQEMQEIEIKIGPKQLQKIKVPEQKPPSATNYSCYDTGNHWCEPCSLQFSTIPKMVEHLHNKGHIEKVDPFKIVAEKEPVKETTGKNTILQPAKGVEFITPLFSFYCSLCDESLINQSFAEQHVKGNTHTVNYQNFLKENPLYVHKRELFRDVAITNLVKEKRKKELAQLCLAKRLIQEKQKAAADRQQSEQESQKKVQEMLLVQKQKEKPVEELDEPLEQISPSKAQVGVGIKLRLANEKDQNKQDEEKSPKLLKDSQYDKSKSEESKASRFRPNPSVIYIGKAPNFKSRSKTGDKIPSKTAKSKSDEQSDSKQTTSISEKNAALDEKWKQTIEKNVFPSTPSSEKQTTTTYPSKQNTTTYPSKQTTTTYPSKQTTTTYPSKQNATTYPSKQNATTYPSKQEDQRSKRQQKTVVSGCQNEAEAVLATQTEVKANPKKIQEKKHPLPRDVPVPKKAAPLPSPSISLLEINLPESKPPVVKTKPVPVKTKPKKPLTEEEKDLFLLGINKSDLTPMAVPKPPPHSLIPGSVDLFAKLPPFPPPLQVPPPNIVLQQSPILQAPYKPANFSPVKTYPITSGTYNPSIYERQKGPDKDIEVIDMEIDECQIEPKIAVRKPPSKSSDVIGGSNQSTKSVIDLSKVFEQAVEETLPVSKNPVEVTMPCNETVTDLMSVVSGESVGATEVEKVGENVVSIIPVDDTTVKLDEPQLTVIDVPKQVQITVPNVTKQVQLIVQDSTEQVLDCSSASDETVQTAEILGTSSMPDKPGEHEKAPDVEHTDIGKANNEAVCSILVTDTSTNEDKQEVLGSELPVNVDCLNIVPEVALKVSDAIQDQQGTGQRAHTTITEEPRAEPTIKDENIEGIERVTDNAQISESIEIKQKVTSEVLLPNVDETADAFVELGAESKKEEIPLATKDAVVDSMVPLPIISEEMKIVNIDSIGPKSEEVMEFDTIPDDKSISQHSIAEQQKVEPTIQVEKVIKEASIPNIGQIVHAELSEKIMKSNAESEQQVNFEVDSIEDKAVPIIVLGDKIKLDEIADIKTTDAAVETTDSAVSLEIPVRIEGLKPLCEPVLGMIDSHELLKNKTEADVKKDHTAKTKLQVENVTKITGISDIEPIDLEHAEISETIIISNTESKQQLISEVRRPEVEINIEPQAGDEVKAEALMELSTEIKGKEIPDIEITTNVMAEKPEMVVPLDTVGTEIQLPQNAKISSVQIETELRTVVEQSNSELAISMDDPEIEMMDVDAKESECEIKELLPINLESPQSAETSDKAFSNVTLQPQSSLDSDYQPGSSPQAPKEPLIVHETIVPKKFVPFYCSEANELVPHSTLVVENKDIETKVSVCAPKTLYPQFNTYENVDVPICSAPTVMVSDPISEDLNVGSNTPVVLADSNLPHLESLNNASDHIKCINASAQGELNPSFRNETVGLERDSQPDAPSESEIKDSFKEQDEPMEMDTHMPSVQNAAEELDDLKTSFPQTLEEKISPSISSFQTTELVEHPDSPNVSITSKIPMVCIEGNESSTFLSQISEEPNRFQDTTEAMDTNLKSPIISNSHVISNESDETSMSSYNIDVKSQCAEKTEDEDKVLAMDPSEIGNKPTVAVEIEEVLCVSSNEITESHNLVEENISSPDSSINMVNKKIIHSSSQGDVSTLEVETGATYTCKQLDNAGSGITIANLPSNSENAKCDQSSEDCRKKESEPTNVEIEKPISSAGQICGEDLGFRNSTSCEELKSQLPEKTEDKQEESARTSVLVSLLQKSSDFKESSTFQGNMEVDPRQEIYEIYPGLRSDEESENIEAISAAPEMLSLNPEESSGFSTSSTGSAVPYLNKFDTEDMLSSNSIDGPPVLSEHQETEVLENNAIIQSSDPEDSKNRDPVTADLNSGIGNEFPNTAPETEGIKERTKVSPNIKRLKASAVQKTKEDSDTDEYEAEDGKE